MKDNARYRAYPELFRYMHINIQDRSDQYVATHFQQAHEFIDNAIANGGAALVHCEQGRSRSATIVISYLIARCNYTVEAAYNYSKSIRPIVAPNIGSCYTWIVLISCCLQVL
jgi:protein-tyrosine phosphatase